MANLGKFSMRKLISLLSMYSFVISFLSGLALYVAPPTRIANAINWTLLGMLKSQHVRIHVVFSIFFVIVACVHVFYNLSAIRQYIKFKLNENVLFRSESFLAILISLLVLWGTMANTMPFAQVMHLSESIKSSWDKK